MTSFVEKTAKTICNNQKGFTFIELMIVIGMITILASMAIANYVPIRRKALDATALSDARNLVETVVVATLDGQDVDYNTGGLDLGGAVGDVDTAANPREPIFVLSSGVRARIVGASNLGASGTTLFQANVYHINGTDAISPSGKLEYYCEVNELAGTTVLP